MSPLVNVAHRTVEFYWLANGGVERVITEVLFECANGHLYTEESARIDGGRVVCRRCQRNLDKRRGKGRGDVA